MADKRKNVRDLFDTCFSRYKDREDILEVQVEDGRIEVYAATEMVDSDDELFYSSQALVESDRQR